MIDPEEIPSLAHINLIALEKAFDDGAKQLKEFAEACREVRGGWQGLKAGYDAPETPQVLAAMDKVRDGGAQLDGEGEQVKKAGREFVEEARTVKTQLKNAREDAEELRREQMADPGSPELAERERKLRRLGRQLWQRYTEANKRCAGQVRDAYEQYTRGGKTGVWGAAAGPGGLLPYQEEAAGRQKAEGLARMFNGNVTRDFHGKDQADFFHNFAGEVESLALYPGAAAAFWAMLKPGVRNNLPSRLIDNGSKTAKTDVRAFGIAFGAALRDNAGTPGFQQAKREFLKPGSKSGNWEKLALLKGSQAPSATITEAVRKFALDEFAHNPDANYESVPADYGKALGLPTDRVALAMDVTGDDGTAARNAFDTMGGDDVDLTRKERLALIMDYAKDPNTDEDEVGDAAGRMISAASGAPEEPVFKTPPTPEEQRFAYDMMTGVHDAAPPSEDDPAGPPKAMQPHLGRIAGVYAAEITEGTNRSDDNDHLPSSPDPVDSKIPGLNPRFRLSPEDAYRFLHSFAGDDEGVRHFDKGMGGIAERLIDKAAEADGGTETKNLERAFQTLGHVRGTELAAQVNVGQALDLQDAEQKSRYKFVANTGLGVAGMAVPGMQGQAAYLLLSIGASEGLDAATDVEVTREEGLLNEDTQLTRAGRHWMANVLMQHGYKPVVPPDAPRYSEHPIADKNGALLPYSKIAEDQEAMRNFSRWLNDNGKGSDDQTELGEMINDLNTDISGSKENTYEALRRKHQVP